MGDEEHYWKGIYGQSKDAHALETMSFKVNIHEMSVNFKDDTPERTLPAICPINPIVELPAQFCVWDVTDTEQVSKIQHASNVYGFMSPIFVVGSVKWYMTFYP